MLTWKSRYAGRDGSARTLVDFDRFIGAVHLVAPAQFSSLAEFNAALADHVSRHQTLVYAPTRHATRFGKHSGELLAEPTKACGSSFRQHIEGDADAHVLGLKRHSPVVEI